MLVTYSATSNRVVDGDTANLSIDLGFGVFFTKDARFARINAPELNSPDPATRTKAQQAKAFVESLLPPGTICHVQSKGVDKYGRPLVEVFTVADLQKSVNQKVLDAGLAVVVSLAIQQGQ